MSVLWMSCCGMSWVGLDRAHCCRRTRGCGHVFDDVDLYDADRLGGDCLDPRTLDLVQTRNGIWLRALDNRDAFPSNVATAAKPIDHRAGSSLTDRPRSTA